jgi:protein ImuB
MLWLCLRLPQLAREAGAASEHEGLERLAGWAYQWSSQIHYRPGSGPSLLWLELEASRALFGAPAVLRQRIERDLARLGYSHQSAVAPTPAAAALLTQASTGERVVATLAQLRSRLIALPLGLLDLPLEVRSALHSVGLRHIGEVLALPSAAIARRFGPESAHYLQQLTGDAHDPQPMWRPPAVYRARCDLGAEAHETTALLFALQRLLLEFQGYLRGRDGAVLRLNLVLEHHRRPATTLTLGFSAATRDAAQFLLLARERLQSLVLPAPVCALALHAPEFTAPAIVQGDLFGSEAQQLAHWTLLLDRLRARLGTDSVHGLALQADHRPEHAWRFVEPMPGVPSAAPRADAAPLRPCALLPAPRRLPAPEHRLSGPERIESGWWQGIDATRDYYRVRAADGAQLWVFRDLSDGSWYVQGLWV